MTNRWLILVATGYLFTVLCTASTVSAADTFGFKAVSDGRQSSDWVVSYSEDPGEQTELIEEALDSPGDRPHVSILAHEKALPVEIKTPKGNEAIVEFDLSEKENSKRLSKKEKRTALLVATAQSALSTFSFIYFSSGSMTAASVAALFNTALTYYFTWDPMRYGRFLDWTKEKVGRLLKGMGLSRFAKSEALGKATKIAATATTTVGFAYAFGSILAWDTFLTKFADPAFIQSSIYNGLLGTFFSGVWDSVFTSWKDSKGSKLSSSEIRGIWRTKSLFASLLGPMIYLNVLPAKILAGASGVIASAALWKTDLSSNAFKKVVSFGRDKAKAIKNKLKSLFSRRSICAKALTPSK